MSKTSAKSLTHTHELNFKTQQPVVVTDPRIPTIEEPIFDKRDTTNKPLFIRIINIADGGHGEVTLVVIPESGELVALKELKTGDPENTLKEAELGVLLLHPNIVEVRGYTEFYLFDPWGPGQGVTSQLKQGILMDFVSLELPIEELENCPDYVAQEAKKLEKYLYDFQRKWPNIKQNPVLMEHCEQLSAPSFPWLGKSYITPGPSLERMVRHWWKAKQNQPKQDILAKFTLQLLSTLNFLHKSEIVHRDIKSTNILVTGRLTSDLSKLNVIIVDLGISKQSLSTETTQTRATLPYEPPEASRGRLGRSSDVYMMCMVLYEMFTGQLLFAWMTHSQKSLRERLDEWKTVLETDSFYQKIPPLKGQRTTALQSLGFSSSEIINVMPPDELMDLIKKGLHPDPASRISLQELIHYARNWMFDYLFLEPKVTKSQAKEFSAQAQSLFHFLLQEHRSLQTIWATMTRSHDDELLTQASTLTFSTKQVSQICSGSLQPEQWIGLLNAFLRHNHVISAKLSQQNVLSLEHKILHLEEEKNTLNHEIDFLLEKKLETGPKLSAQNLSKQKITPIFFHSYAVMSTLFTTIVSFSIFFTLWLFSKNSILFPMPKLNKELILQPLGFLIPCACFSFIGSYFLVLGCQQERKASFWATPQLLLVTMIPYLTMLWFSPKLLGSGVRSMQAVVTGSLWGFIGLLFGSWPVLPPYGLRRFFSLKESLFTKLIKTLFVGFAFTFVTFVFFTLICISLGFEFKVDLLSFILILWFGSFGMFGHCVLGGGVKGLLFNSVLLFLSGMLVVLFLSVNGMLVVPFGILVVPFLSGETASVFDLLTYLLKGSLGFSLLLFLLEKLYLPHPDEHILVEAV